MDLYLLNASQLLVDGNYLFSQEEVEQVAEGVKDALDNAALAQDAIGFATETIPTALNKAGLPNFDTSVSAPQDATLKSLDKLIEQFKAKRQVGTWTLSVPKQHFRFLCVVTEECINGHWTATNREFRGERIGPPTYEKSRSAEVHVLAEPYMSNAWFAMAKPFVDRNNATEKQIAAAANSCAAR